MKALLSHQPGPAGSLRLEEVPAPAPAPGEVLLRTLAVGLNFPDSLIIEDKYQIRPPRPFAPGGELCGEVIGLGAGVERFRLGDRVVSVPLHGALAEVVAVPATATAPIDPILDDVQAAVFPMVYGTVWHALVERARIQPGDRVLVLGAGGGIGLAACEVASALGAEVTAAASSEAKLALARRNGAVKSLIYPAELEGEAQKAFGAALKEIAGSNGFDIVVDPIGGAYAEPALRAVGWKGRYLVIGFTAGIPRFPANLPLLKGCDIVGVFWGSALQRDPDAFRAQVAAMAPLLNAQKLRPKPELVLPLSRAAEAIALLNSRTVSGKIAISF